MKIRLRVAMGALGVVSMVGGFAAIAAPTSAGASTNKWWVASTGTDTGNACTTKSAPCKTITYALAEQAASHVGGTITVKAGTYTQQLNITAANDGVTIKGVGPTTVLQPPASGMTADTDTDSSQPQYAVVDVAPGVTGFNLKNLSVNGTNGVASLDGDSQGCAQDYVGIYYHASSGAVSGVSVSGIDMPQDLFGCQGGQGIYVNSTPTDPATVSVTGVSMLSPSTSVTTTADLPAGSYTNDQLAVTKLPAGFTSGPVVVDGFNLSATKDTKKVLFISGNTNGDAPKGSSVRLSGMFTPAYDKNGITCDDVNTSCTIANSTLQGEGPTNSIAQNGIQAFGAETATITGNTVSGDSYAGGGEGNSASGILILNAGTVTATGNHVSNSDENIYAGEIPAFGLVATPGTWTIDTNVVSGATSVGASAGQGGYGEGIQLDSTTNTVVLSGNTITTSAQSNLLLTGVTGAGIGDVGAGDSGNTITHSQSGIVVGGPGSACETQPSCNPGDPGYGSTGNDFESNTLSNDEAGLVVEGAYAPNEDGLSSDPGAAFGNNFGGNQWGSGFPSSNGNTINMVDFSGFNNPPPGNDMLPPSSPILNQYGPSDPAMVPNTDNSCDPTPGGSEALEALSEGMPLYYSC
jgi:hypothetical protein